MVVEDRDLDGLLERERHGEGRRRGGTRRRRGGGEGR
jgi:hypothetical protein